MSTVQPADATDNCPRPATAVQHVQGVVKGGMNHFMGGLPASFSLAFNASRLRFKMAG